MPDDIDSEALPLRTIERLQKGVLYTTFGVFIASLCFPAYWLTGRNGEAVSMPGYMCVLWLPIAIFGYPAAWANLLLFTWAPLFSSRQFGRNLLAVAVSLIAVILALGFLRRSQMPLDTGAMDVDILRLGLGYYFWVSSMAIALAGALVLIATRNWLRKA
ncbi:MAG: hypothetical protein AAF916_03260 [Planctomycetota bacterium]